MEDSRTHSTVVLPMKRDYPDRPIVGVGAVVVREGRVLVVRRATEPLKGEWSIPGGVLELGEKLREGVVREVLEVFDSIIADPDGKTQYHYVLIDFLCRVNGGALRAGSDVSEARWIDVGELEDLAVRERTVAVIRKGVRASCGVKP
jgi:ADP-ribose pyrophosphatase YjhB (NUDIX family)